MSAIGWIIVIVAVIVIVALIALVLAARKRRREQHAAQAAELRSAALDQRTDLSTARRDAAESEGNAKLARAQADRAEEEAARARRALDQQEAVHEDRLREADRLDPAVDQDADDYRPGANLPPQDGVAADGATGGTYPSSAGDTVPTETVSPSTEERGAHRRD